MKEAEGVHGVAQVEQEVEEPGHVPLGDVGGHGVVSFQVEVRPDGCVGQPAAHPEVGDVTVVVGRDQRNEGRAHVGHGEEVQELSERNHEYCSRASK